MDTEKLNQELYDKMAAEQERFKHELLGMSAEEVLDHAYEYAMRQDILVEMEVLELPADQAAALLASPTPLADVYQKWSDVETRHMEDIRDVIEELADTQVKNREAVHDLPLYRGNARYAREHDELDLFRTSHKANIVCRDAIEAAIRESRNAEQLSAAAKGVLAQFGTERVTHVLAVSLLERHGDKRLPLDIMNWAASVPMFDTGARRYDYAIRSHTFHLLDFTVLARKEITSAWKQQEQSTKRPSIKEQLAAKPVPGETPAKPRDKEAR